MTELQSTSEESKPASEVIRIMNQSSGFTLVEILVTMAIVAIVGTILVVIFTNTLKGNNKAQLLAVIKQNGQAVLENMDKTIRDADNVVCPGPLYREVGAYWGDTLLVVKNGVYTRYRIGIAADSNLPNVCRSNGCITQDNPIRQIDTASGQLETDTAFVLRVCNANDSFSSANILTDTNSQTGVYIIRSSGAHYSFYTNKASGYKDTVTVKFQLRPADGAPAVIRGQIQPVAFQTTIQLR